MQGEQDRWFVLKVFMRIKELDVVSKRQQEQEGEEINVDHLRLDVVGNAVSPTAFSKAVGTQRNVKESLQHGRNQESLIWAHVAAIRSAVPMEMMTMLKRIIWESCGTVGIGTQLMEVVSMCN